MTLLEAGPFLKQLVMPEARVEFAHIEHASLDKARHSVVISIAPDLQADRGEMLRGKDARGHAADIALRPRPAPPVP